MALVRQARPEKLRLDEAIQQFQATLEPPYVAQFAALQIGGAPKPSDVLKLTEEVNRDAYKVHKTWRQYGSRLQKALDQIVVFTKVGDILVGGSQNMIACGVWAAVRLSIQIAAGYLSFFDKVSSLWMRIGRSCEVQEELVQLFPQSDELQTLMSEYLAVTVGFCQRIVSFAKRRLISQIASTFSITFDKESKEFEAQLGHLAKLMNERVKILATQVTLDSSKKLVTATKLLALGSAAARRRDYEQRRAKLLKRLCPIQDRFDQRQRHERKRGPVHWIFEDTNYQRWEHGDYTACLVSGNIGSGKTVVTANIISALQANRDSGWTAVAGFFCRRDEPRSLEPDIVIGSLIHQLVRSLGSTAERAIKRYTPGSTSASELFDYTLRALPKDKTYIVIIDALDECSRESMAEVVLYFARKMTIPDWPNFRLLYSCRTDSPLHPLLIAQYDRGLQGRGLCHISMSNERHDNEIEAYITSEINDRRHVRNLSPELEAAVRAALIAGAQGMFLWVALQLEMLFPRYHASRTLTNSDLTLLLERLPSDLAAAYDHALEHISDPQRARKVFQLVAASQRPLTTSELSVAVNVEPGDTKWEHSTFPLDPSLLVWTSGAGMLEVMEEDASVHYIHHSALRHLLHVETLLTQVPPIPLLTGELPTSWRYRFTLEDASNVLAAICVTFLSYTMHDRQLVKRVNAVGDRNIIDAVSATLFSSHVATGGGSLTTKLIERVLDRRRAPLSQSASSTTKVFDLINDLALQGNFQEEEKAIKQFLEYASRYWLDHTKRFLDPSDLQDKTPAEGSVYVVPAQCYQLFCSLVRSDLAHVGYPWPKHSDSSRVQWALETGHVAVYRVVMRIGFGHGPHSTLAADGPLIYTADNLPEVPTPTPWHDIYNIIHTIETTIHHSPEKVRIAGKEMGAVLALYIYSQRYIEMNTPPYHVVIPLGLAMEQWVTLGVDIDAPLAACDGSLWSPLCLLLQDFALVSEKAADDKTGSDQWNVCLEVLKKGIDHLLKQGANVIGFPSNSLGGPRPLFMALDLDIGEVVETMLGVLPASDVNFEDEAGRTVLGLTILLRKSPAPVIEELVKGLLGMGADPNKVSSFFILPAEAYSAKLGHSGIPQHILRAYSLNPGSGELSYLFHSKVPPLIIALQKRVPSAFKLLLDRHADVYQTHGHRTIHEYIDDALSRGENAGYGVAGVWSQRKKDAYYEILEIWRSAKSRILTHNEVSGFSGTWEQGGLGNN
ncbi:hypothetical protein V8F20_004962 [Naviculisporaceae sp. PSN 640]